MTEQISKIKLILWVLAWLIFGYFFISTLVLFQTGFEAQAICLVLSFLFIFLTKISDTDSRLKQIGLAICLLVGIVAAGYVKFNILHLEMSIGFPERLDVIVGIALILMVLISTWVSWGPMFSCLAIAVIMYFFFGHLLPEPFYHPHIEFNEAISRLSVGLQGMFGGLLGTASDFLILLVIFGCLLDTAGANEFFVQIGRLAGRYLQGGPAHTAVIGSSLVGTTTGAAAANVVITGSVTIPLMKKLGYKDYEAGGIEAAASTGSQLMPPVMGVASFLMADFLGLPYVQIMVAGIVPALMYYFGVGFAVQVLAKKKGLKLVKETVDRNALIKFGPTTLIPIILLIILLAKHYSIPLTIAFCLCVSLVLMHLRKATRPKFTKLTEDIAKGVLIGCQLAVVLATVGMITQVIISTGLGTKLSHVVQVLSFGNIAVMLFLTALLCFFVGQGVPTAPAYVLMAILIAPMLVQSGLPELAVHFFVFYFAVIAAVTPPVALATVTACRIAESRLFATGIVAVKMACAGFVLPFLFFTNPALLLQPSSFVSTCFTLFLATVLIIMLTISIFGHFIRETTILENMIALISAVSLSIYLASHQIISLGLGFGLVIVFILLHVKTGMKGKALGDKQPTAKNI